MGRPAIDLTGKRFGRLVVIERDRTSTSGAGHHARWTCLCDCGKNTSVTSTNLLKGTTKSCGCFTVDRLTSHGYSGTHLYGVWANIKARCNNAKYKGYVHYGNRGISICDEWSNDFMSFRSWAMANGYKEGLTIDRIDNDKGYFPENCRFVTMKEQSYNKRNTLKVTYNGETRNIDELSKITGIRSKTIRERLSYGWSIEDVLTRPVKGMVKNGNNKDQN